MTVREKPLKKSEHASREQTSVRISADVLQDVRVALAVRNRGRSDKLLLQDAVEEGLRLWLRGSPPQIIGLEDLPEEMRVAIAALTDPHADESTRGLLKLIYMNVARLASKG